MKSRFCLGRYLTPADQQAAINPFPGLPRCVSVSLDSDERILFQAHISSAVRRYTMDTQTSDGGLAYGGASLDQSYGRENQFSRPSELGVQ
jgi:hypothetical protein